MAKTTLQDVEGKLLDPLTSSMYTLELNPPEAVGDDNGLLRILCQSCVLPAKTVEDIAVDIHAHKLHFAGKVTFGDAMSITFVETGSMDVYNFLYDWQAMLKNHDTQLGTYKSEYASDGILSVFDQQEKIVASFDIINMWISDLPELTWNEANTLVTVAASFKYDSFKRSTPAHPNTASA